MTAPSDDVVKVAKKVLAKVMAYDPHFSNGSQSIIMAWAEHIAIRNIAEDDLLAGVTRFYEFNQDAKPLPASITFHAREIVRQRGEGMSTEERQALEDARDARLEGREQYVRGPGMAAPQLALPPRGAKITMEEWERLHGERFPDLALGRSVDSAVPNPLRVRCMWCQSPIGQRCVVYGTQQPLSNGESHDCRKAQVEGRCADSVGWHVQPHSKGCERA